jgi:hypothetical protein
MNAPYRFIILLVLFAAAQPACTPNEDALDIPLLYLSNPQNDLTPSITVSNTDEEVTIDLRAYGQAGLSSLSVDYHTADGTGDNAAIAGVNYEAVDDTAEVDNITATEEGASVSLTTLTIPLIPGALTENKTFYVELTNPVAATLDPSTYYNYVTGDADEIGDMETQAFLLRGLMQDTDDEWIARLEVTISPTADAAEDGDGPAATLVPAITNVTAGNYSSNINSSFQVISNGASASPNYVTRYVYAPANISVVLNASGSTTTGDAALTYNWTILDKNGAEVYTTSSTFTTLSTPYNLFQYTGSPYTIQLETSDADGNESAAPASKTLGISS